MRRHCFLVVIVILFLSSCRQIVEQDFFPVPIEIVSAPDKEIFSYDDESFFCSSLGFSRIKDSVIISMERGSDSHLFSVTDMATDSIVGLFCQKGRANNELLDCIPISELYTDGDEDCCADLVSYLDSRLLTWNISESLRSGKDVYDNVVELKSGSGKFLPLMSLYRLDESRIITRNSVRSPKDGSPHEPPAYEMYDTDSGHKIREYAFINSVEAEDDDGDGYDSRTYVSMGDGIKPDGSKMFFAMAYMPVYGILDISSGDLDVFRIKGCRRFSPKERYKHFASIETDDCCIYALYQGTYINEHMLEVANELLVMDWQGRILHKYEIQPGVRSLVRDGAYLYFLKFDGNIFRIETSALNSERMSKH